MEPIDVCGEPQLCLSSYGQWSLKYRGRGFELTVPLPHNLSQIMWAIRHGRLGDEVMERLREITSPSDAAPPSADDSPEASTSE